MTSVLGWRRGSMRDEKGEREEGFVVSCGKSVTSRRQVDVAWGSQHDVIGQTAELRSAEEPRISCPGWVRVFWSDDMPSPQTPGVKTS